MISLRRGKGILSGSSASLRHTTPLLLLCVKANWSMEALHTDYISLFCIVSRGRQCANERYKWKHCIAARINLRIEKTCQRGGTENIFAPPNPAVKRTS